MFSQRKRVQNGLFKGHLAARNDENGKKLGTKVSIALKFRTIDQEKG